MDDISQIAFSPQAAFMRDQLLIEMRESLQRRLEYISAMPRMYPQAEDERYPGCRVFRVEPGHRVFYRVNAGGPGAYIVAIEEDEPDLPAGAGGVDELVIDG